MAYTYRAKSTGSNSRGSVQEKTQVQYSDAGTVTDVSDESPLPVELPSDSTIGLEIGGEALVEGLVSLPVSDQRGKAVLDDILVQLKMMNRYLSVLTNEQFSEIDLRE